MIVVVCELFLLPIKVWHFYRGWRFIDCRKKDYLQSIFTPVVK